jgi:hypothetical protein
MHADGGDTIERRSGTRAATTFRKLPSARPGARAAAASASSTPHVSAAIRDELSAQRKEYQVRPAEFPRASG